MAGQPTKLTAEIKRQVALICRLGATDADLAKIFDVHEDTINNWKKADPEFFESLKTGKDIADAEIERSLFERAKGYSHAAVKIFQHEGQELIVPYTEHYPPDATSMIFWLKNRKPKEWRDRQEHEHKGEVAHNIFINRKPKDG